MIKREFIESFRGIFFVTSEYATTAYIALLLSLNEKETRS